MSHTFRTLLLTTVVSLASLAEVGAQTWVPLDASPPGTPADIDFDAGASNAIESFFDIRIHGYWSEDVAPGDGNVYQRITVPGLAHRGLLGAPDVPVARLRLAVSTLAAQVSLLSVADLDPHVHPNTRVYPEVFEEIDESFDPGFDPGPGDPDGTPEQFTINLLLYGGPPYPGFDGPASSPVGAMLGEIPGAIPEIYPAQFDPIAETLSISGHLRVHFVATGTPVTRPPMTKDRAALASAMFHNWTDQKSSFPTNDDTYDAHYLIVTPQKYVNTLATFVRFKKARGLRVEIVTTESLGGASCEKVRQAIDMWHQGRDPWSDHYALLIGDGAEMPLCTSPTVPPVRTDDRYGSPSDGDLDEEVFVGRLSVDGAGDLAAQLGKIMAYVTDSDDTHYGTALLVADAEGAPGKYVGTHADVANATYNTPPSFTTIAGNVAASDNDTVRQAIAVGAGLVAYRGHASQTTWWNWNLFGDNFHKNELLTIGAKTLGVVWSFACWNNDIAHDVGAVDSLGETWMEEKNSGAVAHYGSTNRGGTEQNHELDRRMFEAVFDRDLVRHGQAITWAESRTLDTVPGDNAWMHMLLGDPSMIVRRQAASPLALVMPSEVPVCAPGQCNPFVVRLVDVAGAPVKGGLVTIYKPGPPGEPDDFLATAYTDGSGAATFPHGPSDVASAIDVSGSDPFGNDVFGQAGVVDGVWANWGGALAGEQGFASLSTDGPLTPMSLVTLELENAAPNSASGLFVALTSVPVPLKGGTLLANPWTLLINLVTDAQGDIALSAPLPSGIPADTELWMQYAIADDAAVQGLALSNAMRGIVP